MSTRVDTHTTAFDLYLNPEVMREILHSDAVRAELAAQAAVLRDRSVAVASSQGVASQAQLSAFDAGVTSEVVESTEVGINLDGEWALGNRPVGVVRQSDDPVVQVVGGRTQAFKGALGSMRS